MRLLSITPDAARTSILYRRVVAYMKKRAASLALVGSTSLTRLTFLGKAIKLRTGDRRHAGCRPNLLCTDEWKGNQGRGKVSG